MNSALFDVLHVDSTKLAELCRMYQVKELAVFGSVARGEATEASDLDIMVEFDPDARIGIIKFQLLSEDLERLTGRPVDLVTKTGLKPRVRPQALKEAQVLYAA